MPDGSYFSHGTPGIYGNSTKLSAMDKATKHAYIAMRRVDQRPESPTPVECASFGDMVVSLAPVFVAFPEDCPSLMMVRAGMEVCEKMLI